VNATSEPLKPFLAEEFIDRQKERDLFRQLVATLDEKRLLTIRDGSDRGKSHLLKLLRHICQYSLVPPVPVSLVPLNELQEKSAYSVVRLIEKSLREEFGLQFTEFRSVADERHALLMGSRGPVLSGQVTAGTASAGTNIAGLKVEGDVIINSPLSKDLEEQLQERAVEAFLVDFRRLCSAQPVALLFDAFEQHGSELEQWIPRFLRDHLFDPDKRLQRLVVVIAGTQIPSATFRDMLQERFETVIEQIDPLSPWKSEDVIKLLDLNKVVGYDDDDVQFLCAKLRSGWSIGRALRTIRQYLREGRDNPD
jgi:hypothetical protein